MDIWKSYGKTDGRRRSKNSICHKCRGKFVQRITGKQIYCSDKCYRESIKAKTTTKACPICFKNFTRRNCEFRGKSGSHFCSKECKNYACSIIGNFKEIQPKQYGTAKSSDICSKRFFENNHKNGCKCGIKTKYLLQVHHIDGDRKNNVSSNLEIVCCNCHIVRHLKFIKEEWKQSTSSLTPRSLIDSLTVFYQHTNQ